MKDFREYYKIKLNKPKIVGKATLEPPATTAVLQSSSSLAVIDLLSEGPIEGLVTKDGKYADGLRLFESFYLNKNPVKQLEVITPQAKDLPFSNIKNISRLTDSNIEKAIEDIITGLSGCANNSENVALRDATILKAQSFKTELVDFVKNNSGLARYGMAQYNISGIFVSGDGHSGRVSLDIVDSVSVPYLSTAFDFRNYLEQISGNKGLVPYKRQIRTENNTEILNIPEDFHFISPVYNDTTTWKNSAGAASNSADGVGKINNNLFPLLNFVGGGVFFFEIGDTDTVIDTDKFHTGRFFVDSSTNDRDAVDLTVNSGITGNYDVFLYSGVNDGLSLESVTSKQVTPIKGSTDGSNVKIGFISDLKSVFNYTNVALDMRLGNEQQVVMDGYEQGKQDFRAGQQLMGRLVYGGSATGVSADDLSDPGATGDGIGGYADQRNGGDFSAWMSNPPLEHDDYPYTHIVERMDVDRVEPTIEIQTLFDTIDAGDDAGVNKPATLALRLEYGFENSVIDDLTTQAGHVGGPIALPSAGDDSDLAKDRISALLSGGNGISNIALGQYFRAKNKTYTSIITSPYMTTIDMSDGTFADLPMPEALKDAKIDQTTIPGLTDFHLTRFSLTSGELLYPNDSWKSVNRFMTIRKLSPETDSSLISRSVSVQYFTETITEKFTYPYAAIAGSTFDARTFNQQPNRQFDVRLKKVLIPSNYEPLNPDGSDKRFIEKSSEYGKRDIYKFKAGSKAEGAAANRSVDLTAHENLKIKGKIKLPGSDLTAYSFDRIFEINRPGSGADNMSYIAFWYNGTSEVWQVRYNRNDSGSSLYAYNTIAYASSNHNDGDIYEFTITLVSSNLTLEVVKAGTVLGNKTITNATRGDRPGVRYYIGMDDPNIPTDGQHFNVNDVQIADYQIYINGELKHWWDGTIIKTKKIRAALKDKVAGNHLEIVGDGANLNDGIDVATDENFEFGRNKEIIYNGHWDGTFKLGWTDNPAWILYDLMINPIYGVGNQIDDREDINIFQLFEIARHCDAVDADGLFDGVPDSTFGLEPRFSCNIRFSQPKNAFEVLGNLASVFRAISFWDGSALTFSSDREKPVSAIFNNGNVFDGFFNYADILSNARFTRVEVPYADAKDEFTTKIEYVEDEERIRQYGVITNKTNGIGCTSKSQARRLGKYIMLSNKLETEIVSFKAGHESIFLEPGDIIRIDDEIKNFEINYGRILEISTGTPGIESPYFIVENQIDPNSIIMGEDAGGLYAYSNQPQTELEELYDISVFNSAHTFGEDNNVISGKLPIETIENSDRSPISKYYITGHLEAPSGLVLYVNSGDSNFASITGVRQGAFFNVELDNKVSGEFKVISIKPEEDNLYSIQALQYDRRKFAMIEDEDFDLEVNNYNIGIPLHTVNRPDAPEFNFGTFEAPTLTHSITGNIIGAAGSNETEYRVTLLKTNRSGPYIQKTFLKDDVSSAEGTQFRINGLIDGDYTVRVTALQNPESSPSVSKRFSIASPSVKYIKPIINKIDGDININQFRTDGTGYGEVQFLSNDCTYNINVLDIYGRNVTVSQSEFLINVYAKTGENYNLVKENHNENQYTFTEVQNRLTYGQMNTGFELRFDLIQNEQIKDTSYYNTTIV
jgi:hypothetical protein